MKKAIVLILLCVMLVGCGDKEPTLEARVARIERDREAERVEDTINLYSAKIRSLAATAVYYNHQEDWLVQSFTEQQHELLIVCQAIDNLSERSLVTINKRKE